MLHGSDEETAIETETCSHAHVFWLEHHSLCTQITLTVNRMEHMLTMTTASVARGLNGEITVSVARGLNSEITVSVAKGLNGEIPMYVARD